MKPSIGRIVHYQSRGSKDGVYAPEPRAAIITQVHPFTEGDDPDAAPIVGLAVLNPTGFFFEQYVAFNDEPLPGCWSWPPKV